MRMTAPLRFGVKFILVFAVLGAAFEASRGSSFERVVVEDMILLPTAALLNTVSPDNDHVALTGRTFLSGESKLHITRGCEGVELFLLLTAAILAFPANLRHRLQGLFLGSILAYALSVARLTVLEETLRYMPNEWETLHGLVMPLAPIIVLAFYFLRWSAAGPMKPTESSYAE